MTAPTRPYGKALAPRPIRHNTYRDTVYCSRLPAGAWAYRSESLPLRVSNPDQHIARPHYAPVHFCICEEIVDEISACSRADRLGLRNLPGVSADGDELHVASIDRLTRP